MAFDPSYAFRRNLEPVAEPVDAGPWRIAALTDLVSEKRYLSFTLRSRSTVDLAPSVLTFRSDAAVVIAPDTCRPALSTTIDGDRLEFLTEHIDLLDPAALDEDEFEPLFESLFEALAAFERHHFHCGDLFAEAVGREPDGRFVLLPNAYILPFFFQDGLPVLQELRARGRAAVSALDHRLDVSTGIVHTQLLARFIERIRQTGAALPQRLEKASRELNAGRIATLEAAWGAIMDRPWPARHATPTPPAATYRPTLDADVARVVDFAARDGAVVLIKGSEYSGKSEIIRRAATALQRDGGCDVVLLDEWDLFSKYGKKSRLNLTSSRPVWIIDDIDDKGLAYSEFSLSMIESDTFPRGTVIMTARGAEASNEVAEFAAEIMRRRDDRFLEIATKTRPGKAGARHLAAFVEKLTGKAPDKPRSPQQLHKALMSALSSEERQLIEFLAVAGFSVPLDIVLGVFADARTDICAAILRLVAVDAIDVFYRRLPQQDRLGLFARLGGNSLRRAIYAEIPETRRRKLHRTIALLGEQQEGFPRYLLLLHCLQSAQPDLAARHVASYLRENRPEKRHPHIVSLCAELWRKGLLDKLPFADRMIAAHEMAVDLLRHGNAAEAETILAGARDIIVQADEDVMLKEAPRVSAIIRLLADRWEERGDFKRALELLDDAREDLQAALPIAEQAQLLNDLGWLQYRLADYESSMESCRLSLNTLNAQQYPLIVAQALNLMGVVHFNTSRYDEAISYYEQSAYLRERSGDENLLAASYNNLALVYQSKGEFEKALEHHNKSLKLKQRQNNRAGIAAGYLNLALLHLESHNLKDAEAKCRESIEICEELGNVQLAADNYITLGDIMLEKDDLTGAEDHYRQAQRISGEREAINEEMGAVRRLASLYIKQERFDEARQHADAAYKLVQRIGSRYEEAQIEVILGDLELEQSRQVEALEHYERAAAQYSALSKYRLGATVLSKIGLIHADNGNNFEARHYFDRAHDFVRADIGRELPVEFVRLQQALRAHPARSLVDGQESQKLLMAFYDLSALTDYALDAQEFLAKIMDVIRRITDPVDCYLGLRSGTGYNVRDSSGADATTPPGNIDVVFDKALTLGSLLESTSADAKDVLGRHTMPRDRGFVAVPLKAMGEDLGCLLFYFQVERLPLSKEDVNFFTWLGRQISGNLKLMLNLNEGFLKSSTATGGATRHQADVHGNRFQDLIGKSETMKRIFRTLEKVRDTDSGILIMGESGTGKSALAAAAHYNSPRSKRPFQEIHCAQIPHNLLESELFGHERGSFTGAVQRKPGLCEMADGGTLFLDDINVMPVETQTKLLHFLETKRFMRLGGTQQLSSDVRIIAASNEDLETMCREGKFREDLYFRLKVILISLPPLRDRKDDMLAIALQYLKKSCAEKGIPLKTLSPEAIQLLQKAPWRGNVRELQNVLERVVVLSDETVITPASLPEDFLKEVMGTSRQSHERLDELVDEIIKLGNYSETNPLLRMLEAMLAQRMVKHVEGKGRAAALLGISKPTLYARLRDFDKLT